MCGKKADKISMKKIEVKRCANL